MNTMKINAILLIASTIILFSCKGNTDKSNCSVLPVQIGEKWGYITTEGEYVINPYLDDADLFSEGLARVCLHNRYGYINQKGAFVLPCEYVGGTTFSEGKAFVTYPEQSPVCINRHGKKLFQIDSVEYVHPFSEGYAMIISADNLYGFINAKGKKVVLPRYASAHDFSEGVAAIQVANQWGYIDDKGEVVIEPKYENVGDFKEGLAPVLSEGKYGFINKKGDMVITPLFDDANAFHEGLACVKTGQSYGFIDKKGHFVINPQFMKAESVNNGMALFQQGSSFGYVNTEGKIVINPIYTYAGSFMGDVAFTYDESVHEKLGMINRKGKTVLAPQFDNGPTLWKKSEFTRSNYYVAEAFIAKLFEGWESNSFFGFNSSKSLGETRSKFTPTKGPSDSTYAFTIKKPEPINGVALTNGVMSFNQKAFRLVDNIIDLGWYRYRDGKKRQYINSCKLKAADYNLELSGIARDKGASLAHSIIKEIASRLSEKYTKEGDSYIIPLTESHPGYTIEYTNNNVTIRATFEGDTHINI